MLKKGYSLIKHKKGLTKIGALSLIIIATFFIGAYAISVFGDVGTAEIGPKAHVPLISISPDTANCGNIPNEFAVHVGNNASSDPIFEVRIYKDIAGILTFACGPKPAGWELEDNTQYDGYCRYYTQRNGTYTIKPGDFLDFKFNATMAKSDACSRLFVISTLDNHVPVGEHKTTDVYLNIDCSDPLIKKTIGQPKVENGATWVTTQTPITILANDSKDTCDLGIAYCRYRINVDGNQGDWIVKENGKLLEFVINFQEDSNHLLEVECYDRAGNKVGLSEKDKVDSTPPVTKKTYGMPFYTDGVSEWIGLKTPITLTSNDPDPTKYSCNIGVDKTFYFDTVVPDDYCYKPETCKPLCLEKIPFPTASPSTSPTALLQGAIAPDCSWQVYEGKPLYKAEESCHIIQFYSVDKLGNAEQMNYQCVFVDNRTPVISKSIGEPKKSCLELEEKGCDYYATTQTNITLTCKDQMPHPSNNVTIYWRYRVDEGNGFGDWKEFSRNKPEVVFNFPENSVHELEAWCIDAVGLESLHDVETIKVDTEPPVIKKEMFGSWLGECPPVNKDDVCYVADNNLSGVIVSADDGNKNHAIDRISCNYGIWWLTAKENCGGTYDAGRCLVEEGSFGESKKIIFKEDSTHDLYVYCQDALGNKASDIERFLVDSTPPVTKKTYGQPRAADEACVEKCAENCGGIILSSDNNECVDNCVHSMCAMWITSATKISLEASDEKSGVDKIYWRNTLLDSDNYCYMPSELCGQAVGKGDFNLYTGAFTKPEQSCHLIEYYAIDKLGNTEKVKRQCVFVDNSAPKVSKKIGEPKIKCDLPGTNDTCQDGSRTYTTDADFDEGILNGLEHNSVHDQLQLILGQATTYPVIWIANAGEDSLSKFDTSTNKELARYHTWFGALANHDDWSGPAPSRTAVDAEGNVYVANRHFDGKPANVIKILSDDWIDRNGNGVMDTSFDNNSDGAIQPSEMIQMKDLNSNGKIDDNEITDERVAWVATVGTNNCVGRSLAIDLNGDIWLGCYNEQAYYKIDGKNGSLLEGPIKTPGHTPYGALVDKNGVLWGASLDAGNLLRLDTNTKNVTVYSHSSYGGNYGIALGYDNESYTRVYLGSYGGYSYIEFNSKTKTFSIPAAVRFSSYGIATDKDGKIIATNSGSGGFTKFYPNGSVVYSAVPQLASEARGVAVDSSNNIWIIYRAADKLGKYSGNNGSHLGLFNTGRGPYTYSDATGLGLRTSVAAGKWNVIYDSGANNSKLGPITWSDLVPEGTSLTVRARSSNDKVTWSPWEDVTEGVQLTSPDARYLEIEAAMKSPLQSSPILYDLSVNGGCGNQNACWFITQQTPITLSCEDVLPHPVDQVSLLYRYRISDDCQNWGKWTEWIDPVGAVAEKTIYFPSDSCHEVEYYCKDALGNSAPIQREIDIVDTKAPQTKKTYEGPLYTKNGSEWIDGVTKVKLDAVDPLPHPSGIKETSYTVQLVNDDYCKNKETCSGWKPGDVKWSIYENAFNISEESCHVIAFKSVDKLGNQENLQWQCVFVDKTKPVTNKTYKAPYYTEKGKEWISSNTEILFSAVDPLPHPSGVKETKYRITRVDDGICANQTLCKAAQGSGDFKTYTGSVKIPEQSCHLIEYYSIDNVQKTETVKKQCTYVDNTAPIPNKTVGEPKTKWDGKDSTYYKDETQHCWDGTGAEIECWKITLFTPIDLQCVDPQPHPVDHVSVCFKVGLDGDDETLSYCKEKKGVYNKNGDGFCCLEDPVFRFKEESEHNLQYYCVDKLGNKGKIDEEKFKVEGTKFQIKIYKKWNLISVPFVLLDSDIKTVFESINKSIESVWTYDGFSKKWYVYRPDNANVSNLKEINPGWGYWIKALNDDNLIIGGSLFNPAAVPPSRDLAKGWNLIGYYGDDSNNSMYDCIKIPVGKASMCALDSLVEPVGDGNPRWSDVESYCEPLNPKQWKGLNLIDSMTPGAGYWILLKSSAADVDQDYLYGPSSVCKLMK